MNIKKKFNDITDINLEQDLTDLEENIQNLGFQYTKNIEEIKELLEKYENEKKKNEDLIKENQQLNEDKERFISIQNKIEKTIYQMIKSIKDDDIKLEQDIEKMLSNENIKDQKIVEKNLFKDFPYPSFLKEKESRFKFYQGNSEDDE